MLRGAVLLLLAGSGLYVVSTAAALPVDDLQQLRAFFQRHFPTVPLAAYADGIYAIDAKRRASWLAQFEPSPLPQLIEQGAALWRQPFPNGSGYGDCFPDGPAIGDRYPRWEPTAGEVVTLPLALNRCRDLNGLPTLEYDGDEMVALLAQVAFRSRGKLPRIEIDVDDPGAMAAYEEGRAFYFARRGQLDFACASCHVQSAGQHLRSERISPAIGHTTGWPTYRQSWRAAGPLHRQFAECTGLMRARPFPQQSRIYRNLEFFLSFIGSGIPLNGPTMRR